jgi:20S proteasome alpha/beta subunit
MKISLNQPNGITTNFGPDSSKYIDTQGKIYFYSENIEQARSGFDPYVYHAGTVVAVAGEDYVVVAGDTRLSQNY